MSSTDRIAVVNCSNASGATTGAAAEVLSPDPRSLIGATAPLRQRSAETAVAIGGRLVLEDGILPGRVTVEDGVITAIEPDPTQAAGPYICPGFVDVHVHGWGGHDAMGHEGALSGMARALLRRGITSFLPTAVTSPLPNLIEFAERVRRWIPDAPVDGAEPLGFNLEGPFISHAKRGAQNPAYIQVPDAIDPDRLKPLVDGLRIVTIAPEVPGAIGLISWFTAHGVAVSLGHSDATVEQADVGYAAGAVSATHLFNAMSGVHNHMPGLAVAALVHDSVWVELIADGYHVDPSVWPLVLRLKPADRLVLVSDAIAIAGTGDVNCTVGGLEVQVRDSQCRLASDGRLAGSVIALDEAVRNLVRAGVSLPLAVGAATRNPLALIGERGRGRLAPGYHADLVELDESLGVLRVMRDGRWCAGPDAAVGRKSSRLKGGQCRSEPAQEPVREAMPVGEEET
jgi:N-acetylglucosamine-6-phosphate deacetylase